MCCGVIRPICEILMIHNDSCLLRSILRLMKNAIVAFVVTRFVKSENISYIISESKNMDLFMCVTDGTKTDNG